VTAASEEINQWRRAQRIELLARRATMTAADRREWSQKIAGYLINDLPILSGATVGFYWPIRGEFDARVAIRALHARGTQLALPVIMNKDAPLEFREWWPGAPMTAGPFGIPVPHGTTRIEPQMLLIPPVGFDLQGFRLGYGGGYYDRTLAAAPVQPLKIALAFELSRMTTILPQPHDVAMDFIVTQAGFHHVNTNGLHPVTAGEVANLAGAMLQNHGPQERRSAPGAAELVPKSSAPLPNASPACYAHEFEAKPDETH
jgi:5,10-methenyltetrahydrofolate synthetase